MGVAMSMTTLTRWADAVKRRCPSALPPMAQGLHPGPSPPIQSLVCPVLPTWSEAASLLQGAARRAARRRTSNEVDPLKLAQHFYPPRERPGLGNQFTYAGVLRRYFFYGKVHAQQLNWQLLSSSV